MKKLLAIAFTLTLVLAGCSPTTNEQTTLEFYTDKPGESIKQVSDELEKAGYSSIEEYYYSDVASFQSAIQQSLPTADAPGLFTWWSGEGMKPLVDEGYLADLTSEWEEYYIPAGVNPELADSMTFDGKIYGAPFNVLYFGVFYNTSVFEEYDLKVPTTFEEFEHVADTLLENGITPIGLNDASWAAFFWFQTLIASYDPQLYTDLVNGDIKYTDDKIYEVMGIYQDWINKGYFSEPGGSSQIQDFSEGKTAMMYDVDNTSIALDRDYGLSAGEDYDIFVFPSMDENNPNTIFYEIAPLLVSVNSAQHDIALNELREYYNSAYQQIMVDVDGFHATDNTELPNTVMKKMQEETSGDSGNQLLLRYYESEPAAVVSTANDQIWKFHFNPTDNQLHDSLETIQNEVDSAK